MPGHETAIGKGKGLKVSDALMAPDLRLVLAMIKAGVGWSVLPDYLCTEELVQRTLSELPTHKPGPDNLLYLVWNKGALRYPRIVHVRDFLLDRTKNQSA